MNRRSVLVLGLIVILGTGCGKTIQKAGGKVLVDGIPVKDGAVTFYPVVAGRPASASIMEDGSFTLSYDRPDDGLPPGEYKVTIVADVWKDSVSAKQKEAMEAMLKKQGAIDDAGLMTAGQLIHVVPPEYNEIDKTPLRETVTKSEKPQEFIFDIKSKKSRNK